MQNQKERNRKHLSEHITDVFKNKQKRVLFIISITIIVIALVMSIALFQKADQTETEPSSEETISILETQETSSDLSASIEAENEKKEQAIVSSINEMQNEHNNQKKNLEISNEKLYDAKASLEQLFKDEQQEKDQLDLYYNNAKTKLDEAEKLLADVKKRLEQTSGECSEILRQPLSLSENLDSQLKDVKEKLDGIELEYGIIYETYMNLSSKLEEYEALQSMKASLKEKLSISISGKMDMSKPIGFTKEEFEYMLRQSHLVKDEVILNTLPQIMVDTVKEYEVNELFSISVMSLECGYFRSSLAVNKHNYGGMIGSDGKGMAFESVEEGLRRAIICLHKNLKGNNTIYEVNLSYCPPTFDGDYGWSESVLKIMKRYASIEID